MSLASLNILPLSPPDAISAQPVNAPLTVQFRTAIPQGWAVRRGKLRHVSIEESGNLIPTETMLNAWDVRGDFLTTSSAEEMLMFLERTGTFSHANESGWTIEELLTFQRVVRYLMSTHPSKWHLTPKVFREVFGDDQRILEIVIRQVDQQVRFVSDSRYTCRCNRDGHNVACDPRDHSRRSSARCHVPVLRSCRLWPPVCRHV